MSGMDKTDDTKPEATDESLLRQTPFLKNPFRYSNIITSVDTIKASDLLLDVAATTTIACLTDGTAVLDVSSAVSYMTFLGLTWWIWASQVLYNVRYRQRDWLHHGFVVLQLLTFCVLAAFAGGFDVSQGIVSDDDSSLISQYARTPQSFTDGILGVEEEARSDYLSRVNSTGISIMLALSRLVLILQYLRVWSCAGRRGAGATEFASAAKKHVAVLSVSLLSYVAAAVVVRTDDAGVTLFHSVAKILLWILPIFLEIAMFCYINWNLDLHQEGQQGGIRELSNTPITKEMVDQRATWLLDEIHAIISRADTVFIVLMGAGLDRITTGFQRIAGNVVVGPKGVGLIFSAGVVFVTQLTLYFNLRKLIKGRMRYRRVMIWFFANFFLFASLILTLQGSAALLELANLINALDLPLSIIYEVGNAVRLRPNATFDPETEFPDLRAPFSQAGLSLDYTVYFINNRIQFFFTQPANFTADNVDTSDPVGASLAVVRISSVVCLQKVLKNVDATPDPGSLLDARIHHFLSSEITNSTDLTIRASRERYTDIISGIRAQHAVPADWYFGVAGATLVMQFILWHILHPDWRDVKKNGLFEPRIQGLRLSFGIITILLLAISANNTVPAIDLSVRIPVYRNSLIHTIAERGWMLAIFAGIIAFEQILEQIVEVHTGRSKRGKPDLPESPPPASRSTADEKVPDKRSSSYTVPGATSDANTTTIAPPDGNGNVQVDIMAVESDHRSAMSK